MEKWEVRRDESRVWLDMWAMVLEKGNMEEGGEEGSGSVVTFCHLYPSSHSSIIPRDSLLSLFFPPKSLLSSPSACGEMAKISFKQEYDLDKRRAEAARIREKYPDRIPVIVEKAERSDIPNIDKKKYLVPSDLTVGQFVYVIRKRIQLSAEKAIFIFVDNVLPPTGALMSTIYDEKKDEDGFLYVTYSGENTFGF
ncbi:hypothetical protein MRB53_027052 [Persea americana]|uniref:Uncharacterized protein n=1 Tax=Persea americana TaxID=3435 RepID=A0ACC2LJS6_PERAE|nr:hypothetical protein MRB53_027052 [Persea americana]